MKKCNILLITTDSHRTDTLSCMGNPLAISPHIDQLASEGILFNNAFTTCPADVPARSSLLTGVYAHVHGCIENGFTPHAHLPLFPDILKQQGYRTFLLGKKYEGFSLDSLNHAFTVDGEKDEDVDDDYARFIRHAGHSRRRQFQPGFPEELHVDHFIASKAIEVLSEIKSTFRPFFMHCSLLSPNYPFDPPGKWAHVYNINTLPAINYHKEEIMGHPELIKDLHGLKRSRIRITSDLIDTNRIQYYGLAAFCDHQVGRIIKAVNTLGLRENTLVIFTADHGRQLMDYGFDGTHNWYNETWRVPLIISKPGTVPIGETREFACTNDIPSTILSAAGTTCDTFQGFDLLTPLIQNEESPRRCAAGSMFRSCALVSKKWKLEYYFEEMNGRLFHRINDKKERYNLYDDPAYSKVKSQLLTALLSWRGDTADIRGMRYRSHIDGMVSQRAINYVNTMKGTDTEIRLNDICYELDQVH